MKLAQLKKIIEKGECEHIEFKTSTGSITSGVQTVCAFLNSKEGGIFVFGVTDSGQIVGQAVSDKTRKDIAIETAKIEPFIKIDIIYIPVEDTKFVIVFKVDGGDKGPYLYDGRAFIRNQSTTMRMARDEFVDLHHQSNQTLWESLPNDRCTVKDLDTNRIKEIVRMGVFEKRLPESAASLSVSNLLIKFGLFVEGKLNNAAVLLFCKKEDKQFFQSSIQLARFKGIDKTEFLDTKLLRGNIFDLYDKAMDFLVFCLPVAARIEEGNPVRVETPAIPYKVLREALVNAFIHRDYSYSGGTILVAVYDNRINITNSGTVPKGVQFNQLSKEHPSVPRNPLIAGVFYACGKIEKWGRGTLDMIQDCIKVGNPIPVYSEVCGCFSITLYFKESIRSIYEVAKSIASVTITPRQKEILSILDATQGQSRHEIMTKLQIQLTDRVMQLELAKLKNLGLVKSQGKANATLWFLVDKNR